MIRAAVAQSWGTAVARACKKPFPDCSRCRRPQYKNMRESWGCDAPAERPVWSSPCPECRGTEDECDACKGTGEVEYYQCPRAIIESASKPTRVKLDLLMRAYHHYDRRNVLPSEGAWLDQSRSFLACVEIIDSERGHWEQVMHEHQEREMKRVQAQGKQMKGRR